MASSLQDVIDQMAEWGITGLAASDLVADGKYHRYRPDGGKKKKSAWYVLWEHRTRNDRVVVTGAFGNGPDTYTIKPSDTKWTMEERADFAAAQKLREREAAKQRKAEADSAAAKATRLWALAHDEGASDYLDRKRVRSFGLKFMNGMVLVPMRGPDGATRGCQYISADGSKRFNTGCEKAGAFHALGEVVPDGRLLFAEGYATAASLHMALGYPVVVCFDAGNMLPVSQSLRPLYPDAEFIFCGDDDRHVRRRLRERLEKLGLPPEGVEPDGTLHVFHLEQADGTKQEVRVAANFEKHEGEMAIGLAIRRDGGELRRYWLENAGRKAANACAKKFKGVAVFPSFAADAADGTDFNDVHLAEGLGVVRSQVLGQLNAAKAGDMDGPPPMESDSAGPPDLPPDGPPDGPGGGGEPPVSDDGWKQYFRRSKQTGEVTGSLYNTLLVLEYDPAWRGVIVFDEFAQRIMKARASPAGKPGEWSDADDVVLMAYLTKRYRFEPKKPTIMDAVLHIGYEHRIHPVRAYLTGLVWDGVPRLRKALSAYWGTLSTADTASLDQNELRRLEVYLQLVSVKWFVGAVARIMRPGCKLDTMLVFEGGQGARKSSSLRALFGEWFADSKLVLGDKDATAQMQGVWGYEMGEMDAFSKAEDNLFKLFMSTQSDRWREHYAKRARDVPRQSIFIGTTNQRQYGKDPTGMRRVWPVLVGTIDVDAIARDRDQLWAEAVQMFNQGARWWIERDVVILDPAKQVWIDRQWSEWDLFKEQADSRQQEDAWRTPIIEYIYTTMSGKDHFSTAELMADALKLDRSRWSKPEQMRVAAIMQQLGWDNRKRGPVNARYNAWIRPVAEVVPTPATPQDEEDDDIPF